MYQQALAGYEKVLGSEHSKTCMVASNLGSLASPHVEKDTSCHTHSDFPAVQIFRPNNVEGHTTERPRKRDKLYRFLRR
ncbi:hypothetical protein BDW71DRAFT_179836 [Aspergillus fruticulosus]